MDVETVVDRLRESKAEFEITERAAGYAEGALWATERARYGELLALWDWDPDTGWDEGDERLALAMDRVAGRQHPDSIFALYREQQRFPSDFWARGFFQGALTIWTATYDGIHA